MSVVDDIKARLDIVSYINQYVPLKKSGKNHKACCPFHSEKTPSFVVDENRQSWRCFGSCAEGGDIFSFVQKYHGWDFKEALRELGQLAGVEVRKQTPEQKQRADHVESLRLMLKEAASAYYKKLYDPKDPRAVAALRYAREERGLSDETIAAFGIGYAPPGWDKLLGYLTELGYKEEDILAAGLASKSDRTGKVYDRFRNRLVVPIRDERGRVVGFGGRILDPDDTPKYLNSPQNDVFDKSHILFGLDLARDTIRETETAVIVEGYMDAITAHQAGFTNVVAQMGTAMTETQLNLIAPKWARRVVLALDSDSAGQNATRRSLEVAREALQADYTGRMSVDMRVLHIPDAKDPDDLIRETPAQWDTLVKHAMSVADFVIQMEMAALPPEATIQDKEALARRVMPLLLATENNLVQQENVQKLALRLLIPERDLLRLAREQAKIQQARPPKIRKLKPEDDEQPPPRADYDNPPSPGGDNDDDEQPPPRTDLDAAPQAQPEQVISQRVIRREAHALHCLLKDPNTYYRANGKVREVADHSPFPEHAAFAPLGTEDFTHDDLREIMALFLRGLNQDDMDVVDYIIAYAEDHLHETLEQVLEDSMYNHLTDTSRVSEGDFNHVMERVRRSGLLVDERSDWLAQMFRLRCQRLMRQREELRLIQMNASRSGDHEQADACAVQIDALAYAVHLLAMQEKQVSMAI